jgi:hypothetical protein
MNCNGVLLKDAPDAIASVAAAVEGTSAFFQCFIDMQLRDF